MGQKSGQKTAQKAEKWRKRMNNSKKTAFLGHFEGRPA
jgi:hypothetical protein